MDGVKGSRHREEDGYWLAFQAVWWVLARFSSVQFSSVQSLSRVWLFATPWNTAYQASLSITNSCSLLKLMSITSVMPSNHLIFCLPLPLLPSVFPSIRSFPMSQFFASGSQSIGVSASTSVLPMNIQDWFPLGLTGWISSMILLKRGTENYVALHGFKNVCCHKEKSVMEIYLLSCLQWLE